MSTKLPRSARNDRKSVHFIGIGGIGVSALARYYLAQKRAVSGSDLNSSVITEELKKEGVKIKIGHKKTNLPPLTDIVIRSPAVPLENPEVVEAKKRDVPVLTYPEALGKLTEKYKTIAIAGAHGKTTTTALVSLALIQGGLDPTVVIGTRLKEFQNKNFRLGKSSYLVIEADEWAKSFLNYSPALAVITNIDKEHLDYYKNYAGVKSAFLKFIGRIKTSGTLVLNEDALGISSMRGKIEKIGESKKLKIIWFSLKSPVAKKIRGALKISGEHNVSNALAAYRIAKSAGVKDDAIMKAFGKYEGAWRRMEYKGELKIINKELRDGGKINGLSLNLNLQLTTHNLQLPVYDDYAHHPTEIKATLAAFKNKYPGQPIICIFQPHQGERLRLLFNEFSKAFSLADASIILPIYQVAGRDKPHKKYTSKALVDLIQKKGRAPRAIYLNSPKKIRQTLHKIIGDLTAGSRSPITIMMGAGNIADYTDGLIKKKSNA